MFGALADKLLTSASANGHRLPERLVKTRRVETPTGAIRVFDSAHEANDLSTLACVVIVPDGPNVIEHYAKLIALLKPHLRVVCFDMPGFGHSLPGSNYTHSLDDGARAVIGVLDAIGIEAATLAFSYANGFYAIRAAQLAPHRVVQLVLSQTPSLASMHAWARRVVPWPLRFPVMGQLLGWMFRRKAVRGWYRIALPRGTSSDTIANGFEGPAIRSLGLGGCFCLAGVVQGLARENQASLLGGRTPCTMVWGRQDRSHKYTDPASLNHLAPEAEIVHFEDCGHFPDVEQPARFAALLIERIARHG